MVNRLLVAQISSLSYLYCFAQSVKLANMILQMWMSAVKVQPLAAKLAQMWLVPSHVLADKGLS